MVESRGGLTMASSSDIRSFGTRRHRRVTLPRHVSPAGRSFCYGVTGGCHSQYEPAFAVNVPSEEQARLMTRRAVAVGRRIGPD